MVVSLQPHIYQQAGAKGLVGKEAAGAAAQRARVARRDEEEEPERPQQGHGGGHGARPRETPASRAKQTPNCEVAKSDIFVLKSHTSEVIWLF